jgi:anti-sigma factor RsiW
MLCNDFQDRMTDYLDGALEHDMHKSFAEHALRCPVCHETLSEVKNTMQACRAANGLETPRELEARILLSTMPETAMTCEDFEEFLTDYLDGFLPAPLYHRWERHAVLCARCTELPGEVVRAIGTCYIYVGEEKPLPAGLHERILLATSGSRISQEIRASFGERLASWLRLWLDPIISPQLATVATMLLVAVFVLTNTVSADGSISGVYSASLRLAEQSYAAGSSGGIKEITLGLKELVGGQRQSAPPAAEQNQGGSQPKQSPKQNSAPNKNRQNKP